MGTPEADRLAFAGLLLPPGSIDVVELRALKVPHGRRHATVSGYFNDPEKLAVAAETLDERAGKGIYVTLNPVLPELLARANNRVVAFPETTTADDQIARRRFLLIDADPERASGISATDEEKARAATVTAQVSKYLESHGFAAPVYADSGNGYHLLYAIDLPVDDNGLLRSLLDGLARRFDGNGVKIDQTVFNPARIGKLFGTMTRKGDSIAERPHRRSAILSLPDPLVVVPAGLIESVIAELAPTDHALKSDARGAGRSGASVRIDVDSFLARTGLEVAKSGPWKDATRWILKRCPFNPEHEDGAAFVVQFANGAVAAGCHHNSCYGKRWQDLRALYEPHARASHERVTETHGFVPADDAKARAHGAAGDAAGTKAAKVPRRPARQQIPPYTPLPVEALPNPIGVFIAEGAAAIGCDPAFVALPTLAVLASSIGNTRRIRLKRGWQEPCVLWTATIADSGSLKSPAHDLALRPLRKLQAEKLREWQEAMKAHKVELLQYAIELKEWKKLGDGDPPEPPVEPPLIRFICSDITVEALAIVLASTPRGILNERDELAGWINSFNAYKQGKGSDAAHWLEMHRAGHLLVDRKTGDRHVVYVPRAAVSLTGGIQPGTFRRCVADEHLENGMAARLLAAYPPRQPKKWTDADVSDETLRGYEDVVAGLLKLDFTTDPMDALQPIDLFLSKAGKRRWVEFYDEHGAEQATMIGPLAAAWSKLEGYAARLALIVHCVREVTGDPTVEEGFVDDRSIAAGVTLSRWFSREAERVYALLGESDEDRDLRALADLIRSYGGATTVRELQQHCRKYRRSAEEARAALQGLFDAQLCRKEERMPRGGVGRPTEVFVLNELEPEPAGLVLPLLPLPEAVGASTDFATDGHSDAWEGPDCVTGDPNAFGPPGNTIPDSATPVGVSLPPLPLSSVPSDSAAARDFDGGVGGNGNTTPLALSEGHEEGVLLPPELGADDDTEEF